MWTLINWPWPAWCEQGHILLFCNQKVMIKSKNWSSIKKDNLSCRYDVVD